MSKAHELIPRFSDQGFLEGLQYEGTELIIPWGIETADPWGFFSPNQDGVRCISQRSVSTEPMKMSAAFSVAVGRTHLDITEEASVQGDTVHRAVCMTPLQDTHIADFVAQYRFRSELFHTALINGIQLPHRNTGLNYMHPVEHVTLIGEKLQVDIDVRQWSGAGKFRMFAYVRDNPGLWTVHLRQLPKHGDREYVKIGKSWFNSQPLPSLLSAVLLRIPRFRRRFWYGGERRKPRGLLFYFNPTIFPYGLLKAGETLTIESTCRISER